MIVLYVFLATGLLAALGIFLGTSQQLDAKCHALCGQQSEPSLPFIAKVLGRMFLFWI